MLKQHHKLSLITAALVAAGAANASDYVSANGAPLRNAFGECVRTGYWAAGSADCDAKPVVAAAVAQPQVAQPPVAPSQPATVAPATVFFAFDQAELDPDGRRVLDGWMDKLRAAGVDRVVAVGYADALGPDQYNQRLSELRVRAVRDYLLEKGLPMRAVAIEARGKREPLARCQGTTDKKGAAMLIACLQPDRRVEIEAVATPRPASQTAAAGK